MTTLAHRIPLSVLPNRRTGIAIFLLMAPCIMGHAAESESWQRAPSEGQIRSLLNLPAIPKADIYEVVPTKVETALVWYFAKVPFAVLTVRALMLTSCWLSLQLRRQQEAGSCAGCVCKWWHR